MKAYVESPAVRRKMDEDENKAKRAEAATAPVLSDIERGNEAFVQDTRIMVKQNIELQDEALAKLGVAVESLGDKSKVIHEELVSQNKMLSKLDEDLDDAGNKMNFVMAKLSKLLKTKDGCQLWTIVILALILIALGMLCHTMRCLLDLNIY